MPKSSGRSSRTPESAPAQTISSRGDPAAPRKESPSAPTRYGASSGAAITARKNGSCWLRVGEASSPVRSGAPRLLAAPARCSSSGRGGRSCDCAWVGPPSESAIRRAAESRSIGCYFSNTASAFAYRIDEEGTFACLEASGPEQMTALGRKRECAGTTMRFNELAPRFAPGLDDVGVNPRRNCDDSGCDRLPALGIPYVFVELTVYAELCLSRQCDCRLTAEEGVQSQEVTTSRRAPNSPARGS